MADSRGRDTSALMKVNAATGETTLITEDPRADLTDVLLHPVTHNVQAVAFTYERKQWHILDHDLQGDFDYLKTVIDGELSIDSRTLYDQQWIVSYQMDNGPVKYYRYDRAARQATFLFAHRDDVANYQLSKMHPVVITARDGLSLVSYYTLPLGSDTQQEGKPDQPVPMVLFVHGGPWGRDHWGYNGFHQWLANRGYAVLSVNFRASTGFGKAFTNAGDLQWGRTMHDDLLDAVAWAVEASVETMLAEAQAEFPLDREAVESICSAVRCPMLLVHGSEDTCQPLARAERLAELTGAPLVVVEGADHMIPGRHPVLANLLIRDFVRSLEGGRP
jgi:dipeptidyl aminopeptidase/acylaminoacyl peptidase